MESQKEYVHEHEWKALVRTYEELIPDKEVRTKIDEIIEEYSEQPGQLIRVLQRSQEIVGYLPEEVQCYIAARMDLPVSEVAGVVSFYSLFSTEPKGKFTISVCLGTACYVKGAQDIVDAIKENLSIDVKETTPDGLFTLEGSRCIGACGLAPVLSINEKIYGRVKKEDIPTILASYKKTEPEEPKE
ncbi:NADH-quinone oxidoreductase subunit NuoE family protein [Heliorestis convoluta]|uniref:NADH-quinone oxidoreductase, 24 kDa subunit, chain E n=1 Tax=Heliorestis convoluta TaxID=356322 RepID=A0A5Q2N3Y2_9FIRM|nr:NAD(P)H-dependent oxidoreductase subunit E [Heliorestis convoluta]QGG48603.1 NADH-quinone oxidoreductase, 24 kDa subunit, chain E [Heliorestis convoluta]